MGALRKLHNSLMGKRSKGADGAAEAVPEAQGDRKDAPQGQRASSSAATAPGDFDLTKTADIERYLAQQQDIAWRAKVRIAQPPQQETPRG